MARPSGRDIRRAALEEAERTICSAGIAGLSYPELGRRLGVRAPSLHHHFRHKDDLVAETTQRYRTAFRDRVAALEPGPAPERLRTYASVFLAAGRSGRLCLCGAAAAGWEQLGVDARREVATFFRDEIAWVAGEVRAGVGDGSLRVDLDPERAAEALVGLLEGLLLVHRVGVGGDAVATVDALLDSWCPPS